MKSSTFLRGEAVVPRRPVLPGIVDHAGREGALYEAGREGRGRIVDASVGLDRQLRPPGGVCVFAQGMRGEVWLEM